MNPSKTMLLGAACVLMFGGCSALKSPPPEPEVSVASSVEEGDERVERSSTVTVTTVVEAVDHEKRLVTLRGPDGTSSVIHVDEAVKNLPQVRKGDEVKVEYYESVAFQLRKPGEVNVGDAAIAEGTETAQPGEKPGAAGARAITIVTEVEAVDKANGTVTLKGPEGRSETIKAQNPANLDKVKVGDTLQVTYTQAVAISVEKP